MDHSLSTCECVPVTQDATRHQAANAAQATDTTWSGLLHSTDSMDVGNIAVAGDMSEARRGVRCEGSSSYCSRVVKLRTNFVPRQSFRIPRMTHKSSSTLRSADWCARGGARDLRRAMAVDTVALTIGLLSAFIVVVALAAQIRYSRYSKLSLIHI